MLSECQENLPFRILKTTGLSLLRLSYRRHLRRSWLRNWVIFWQVTICFPLPNYRTVGTKNMSCFAHVVLPYTSCLGRGMEGSLVQLDLSAVFHRVSHSGMLYKLGYICVGGQFLSIHSKKKGSSMVVQIGQRGYLEPFAIWTRLRDLQTMFSCEKP